MNRKQTTKLKLKKLLKQQDWPQIEKLCTEWLEWEPQRARTFYSRALSLVGMKRYQEAIVDLEKSLELKPHLEPALKLLPKVRKIRAKLETFPLKKPLVVSIENPIIVALEQPIFTTKVRKRIPRAERNKYLAKPNQEENQ